MSARSKGLRHEKELAELLERNGYLVQRAGQKVRWIGPNRVVSQQADFFGCVDLLGIDGGGEVWFIQAGTRDSGSRKRREIEETFTPKYHTGSYRVVLALWGQWPEVPRAWAWRLEDLTWNGEEAEWTVFGYLQRTGEWWAVDTRQTKSANQA